LYHNSPDTQKIIQLLKNHISGGPNLVGGRFLIKSFLKESISKLRYCEWARQSPDRGHSSCKGPVVGRSLAARELIEAAVAGSQ
jgi:hypothetical protein